MIILAMVLILLATTLALPSVISVLQAKILARLTQCLNALEAIKERTHDSYIQQLQEEQNQWKLSNPT